MRRRIDGNLLIQTVRTQPARLDIVGEKALKNSNESLTKPAIPYRSQQFEPPVEIAAHPVRAADEDFVMAAILKVEYAGMLEVAVHDGVNHDVPRDAFDSRPQTADATDVQLDVDASLAGSV